DLVVNEKGFTSHVSGGIKYLGNMFKYKGPMLWMFNLTYDNNTSKDQVMTAVDSVITNLRSQVTKESVAGALVKMRSSLYDELGGSFGLGRADLLCSFALFDDDPARINTLGEECKKVTREIMLET